MRGTPNPTKLMAKANSSAKLMNAMKGTPARRPSQGRTLRCCAAALLLLLPLLASIPLLMVPCPLRCPPDLNLNGQSAVAKYYNHVDLEVRNFVKDLCDAGFSPAEPKPQANPFSRNMSHYNPRSIIADRQPPKGQYYPKGQDQEYYQPEADENYEPYGRVQGSNVAIRGGWPTEQAYAAQRGNINGIDRQRPF